MLFYEMGVADDFASVLLCHALVIQCESFLSQIPDLFLPIIWISSRIDHNPGGLKFCGIYTL